MASLADEIYEATGILFGATQLAAMAQFIRTREDAARQQGRVEGAAVGAEDLTNARREGIEAAAAVASKRAASRHSTVAHCHSDRSKKHMQIRADEAGQLVADIRALLEGER